MIEVVRTLEWFKHVVSHLAQPEFCAGEKCSGCLRSDLDWLDQDIDASLEILRSYMKSKHGKVRQTDGKVE